MTDYASENEVVTKSLDNESVSKAEIEYSPVRERRPPVWLNGDFEACQATAVPPVIEALVTVREVLNSDEKEKHAQAMKAEYQSIISNYRVCIKSSGNRATTS